jgi:hypothetical protein
MDYNLVSYPADVSVNQTNQFATFSPINKTPIAKLPTLSAQLNLDADPGVVNDSRAILIDGFADNVPNPFHTLFGIGDESLWPFAKWTDASIIHCDSAAQIVREQTTTGQTRFWFSYTQPDQTCQLHLAGHSDLGWFIRQIAEVSFTSVDIDNDGMADQWEQRWCVDDPLADDDGDGDNNLKEFEDGTVPGDCAQVQQASLVLIVEGQGSVSVSPPNDDCNNQSGVASTECLYGPYDANGLAITLLPSPAIDHQFSHWQGACTGSGSCVFDLTDDIGITAVFSPTSVPVPRCTTPWGTQIDDGTSVVAYREATVSSGNSCDSEERQCSNGQLTGSYLYSGCTVSMPGSISRVSVANDGSQANNHSYRSSVSVGGRYIAFSSLESNLVMNNTNDIYGKSDIFIHDRQTGQTQQVSVASDGSQTNSNSNFPSMSADGRYIAFLSGASNLVVNDATIAGPWYLYP